MPSHGSENTLPGAAVDSTEVDAVMTGTQVLGGLIAESLATVENRVTMPQLRVLMLASTRQPLNLSSVAHDLGVHPSNATRTCDRLVAAGLLERRTSTVDRRHLDLRLTKEGRSLVETVIRHRRTRIEDLLGRLSPTARASLARSLRALAAAASEAEREATDD